ncbi:pyridoxamine 5'-phosphate oxidase family protein [Nocardioides marmoriginsengisoli]|uniref:Pyridoxamine 5'-phosphate oxidase family protein n=1 Tax=Nocardioides marmoriginsengisoli TaxID=661483 RepID=A0A3N0CBB2_9ACTN|nr:pyridoxamine 5'-phosphate oxidase family protein [Nocardioides marmoriginsengisoli]RNL60531.1 pyridoxamine 5'-phosphate oxidase family protein [Nocardioides marmoriginsengisoli]
MSERTRLRRIPENAVTEVAGLHAVLDAARVAHVAFVHDGGPVNIPTAVARDGDRLLMHGSTGSRLFRTLADGAEVCVTVTLLDGMVLARSAFESSMNYRSAMVFGVPTVVTDKLDALRVMTAAWMPGRWETLRAPHAKELAATMVLELPLVEWSVKVSAGPPEDPPEDLDAPVWAGVLPIVSSYGEPVPAPDLRGDPPLPAYFSA